MKALITAGGKGTRMRPLTFSTNKHLVSLANKPLLFYPIEEVVETGIKEIGINYNPGQLEELQSVLGNGERWGVKLTFILQEKPAGLANIIQVSEQFLGKDKFLMHLGDNIFYGGIKTFVNDFLENDFDGLVTILHHKENSRLGVPLLDKEGKMVKYLEKPANPPNDWAIPGLYFFNHKVFDCFKGKGAIKPSARGEYEISAPYQWMIDHGLKVETREFTGIWKDPGKFDDWIATNQFLLEHNLEPGTESVLSKNVKIKGKVKIGKNCQIENSSLEGPTIIGDNVCIKGSFIGSHCSLNDGCEIINAKIKNAILEKAVKITDSLKLITNSLIGREVIIEGKTPLSETMELFVGDQCSIKLY